MLISIISSASWTLQQGGEGGRRRREGRGRGEDGGAWGTKERGEEKGWEEEEERKQKSFG